MNTKVLVSLALLVGMGAVLHAVIPPIFLGMKPDMMLTMMFLGIMLFPQARSVLVLAIATGAIAALTTSFPNGQVANMIDKPLTAFLFLGLFLAVRRYKQSVVSAAVLTAIGTIVSGMIFLAAALALGSFSATQFFGLVAAVVLPATAVNMFAMIVIYPIVQTIVKRSKITSQMS
ncbi:tryptophan transporter [Priestia endophytica]|uniref:Tryptophan transporter n=1 Tax=Priestia endophytica TaxID=135735 RepID=A0AAX1Q4I9_9BACI|nr:tryptophan transporter [Priestia endophytica]RAS72450.1 tryptophan transporter [Priestia endophytica]RAS90088.1 tryptophan transporter [Priestia endophytica]